MGVVVVVQRRLYRRNRPHDRKVERHDRQPAARVGAHDLHTRHPRPRQVRGVEAGQIGREHDRADRVRPRRERDAVRNKVSNQRRRPVGKVLVVQRQTDRRAGRWPRTVRDRDRLLRRRRVAVAVRDLVAERGRRRTDQTRHRIKRPHTRLRHRVGAVGIRIRQPRQRNRRLDTANRDRRHNRPVRTLAVVRKHVAADGPGRIFRNRLRRIIDRRRNIVDDLDGQCCRGGVAVGVGHDDLEVVELSAIGSLDGIVVGGIDQRVGVGHLTGHGIEAGDLQHSERSRHGIAGQSAITDDDDTTDRHGGNAIRRVDRERAALLFQIGRGLGAVGQAGLGYLRVATLDGRDEIENLHAIVFFFHARRQDLVERRPVKYEFRRWQQRRHGEWIADAALGRRQACAGPPLASTTVAGRDLDIGDAERRGQGRRRNLDAADDDADDLERCAFCRDRVLERNFSAVWLTQDQVFAIDDDVVDRGAFRQDENLARRIDDHALGRDFLADFGLCQSERRFQILSVGAAVVDDRLQPMLEAGVVVWACLATLHELQLSL